MIIPFLFATLSSLSSGSLVFVQNYLEQDDFVQTESFDNISTMSNKVQKKSKKKRGRGRPRKS